MWPVADEDILTEELLNPIGMYKVSQKYHLYIALSLDLKEFLVAMKVFTVRRSALHGLCDRNSVRLSVCPSVCHTRGLCPHGSTYYHDFFTIW